MISDLKDYRYTLLARTASCVSTLSLAFLAMGIALAQTPVAPAPAPRLDLYTPEELRAKEQTLKQKADESGAGKASVVLEKYPGHSTMIGFRERSGEAELHREDADIDVILDGSCTLIVGGTIPDGRSTGPAEMRGASIQGGQSSTLHKGDILHIPANTPHQMLLPPGGTVTYFVIKAIERSQP